MPSLWRGLSFRSENEVGSIIFKMPVRKYSNEISAEAIRLRRALASRWGNPYYDDKGNLKPITEVNTDLARDFESRDKNRWFEIAKKLDIKLSGNWEGIDFEPDTVLDDAKKAQWADAFYTYAETLGEYVETLCVLGQPASPTDRILTIDDLERAVARALLTAESPEDFKKRIEVAGEQFRKINTEIMEKLNRERNKKDINENPTK